MALLISAIVLGLLEKEPLDKLVVSIQNGFGSTLGSLGLVVAFGVVIGKLMTDSGAAQRVAQTLIQKFGKKNVKWAIIITGFIFGIAMFYEVAFITLAPLIISIAIEAEIPFLPLAMSMIAATTTAHSLFPPQPGATALVQAYHANIGMTYILGIIVAVPTILCSGILLPKLLKGLDKIPIPTLLSKPKSFTEEEMPSFGISVLVPLIPAIIITAATILNIWIEKATVAYQIINFFGNEIISMLIAVLVAIVAFGIGRNKSMTDIMDSFSSAISSVTLIVFIIGAGGAFKQIIGDTSIGTYIAELMKHSSISPFILAWIITVILRLATGAGTVSAITAAGIVGPLIPTFHVSPELMVLATASASNTITHVNDAAFWLYKETFGLSLKDTFKTWGLSELTNSVVGLIIVLILSLFIH
ncbi:gluconate:H+ symporter [Pullulanibacillus sp. KACC 23026]|uniref:gluconate:H+ symporter n=1 Tax=Pullulanibacillus sp. KACC 23026 TaxID=3028315 RepID=UPI0023B09742|nr:gluconate:H+ symporter [Pullulanibacillus sp. KACC 23026]WEG12830.1 gluconate:H+ symporter [Pullulanibacillus sp. KACC 23026]